MSPLATVKMIAQAAIDELTTRHVGENIIVIRTVVKQAVFSEDAVTQLVVDAIDSLNIVEKLSSNFFDGRQAVNLLCQCLQIHVTGRRKIIVRGTARHSSQCCCSCGNCSPCQEIATIHFVNPFRSYLLEPLSQASHAPAP